MDMPAQQHFNTSEANVDDRFLIKNADLPGVKIHERERWWRVKMTEIVSNSSSIEMLALKMMHSSTHQA